MFGRQRALDNPINWSFRIGRLFDIDIRVHIAFVLCAFVLVWMERPEPGSSSSVAWSQVLVDALGVYALLFLIVLLHEFGHCFGARHTGGEAEEILLWPLGGLASVNPPHNAGAHFITAFAGPLVNVVICLICSVVLVAWIGRVGAVPWNPIHPMWPVDPAVFPTTAQLWVMRCFGISYFLLLINLLPVFPFDGGRLLQAWLWPKKGYRASMELATGTGMVGAILIGLVGLFLEESWLLLMIAVFGYVTCWQTRRMIREHGDTALMGLGGEFGEGYTFWNQDEAETRRPGFFERRRRKRAARIAERDRLRQEEHEAAVERILKKVSESGLSSLTASERRILAEETQRRRELTAGSRDPRNP